MTLTKDQKKAVYASGKNILVSAGAGTGKTRVLVESAPLAEAADGLVLPDLAYTWAGATEKNA